MRWRYGIPLLIAAFCMMSANAAPPPIPKGYPSQEAIVAAVQSGQLKLAEAFNLPTPDSIEETKGIEYGKAGDKSLQLDLYRPKSTSKPTPVILFIHGGGWKSGNRADMKYYCLYFAQKGYITATMSYRLAGEAKYPAAVQDAKCAVRWLRANAKQYSIDPNRIVVSGNSAGGHLSLMVGYAQDPALEGDSGNAGVSSKVRAVVDFYGPVDLTGDDARDNGLVNNFIGKPFDQAKDAYQQASPLFHLDKKDPPTLIFHGTIDDTVNIRHADRLDKQLTELGIDHVYERYEGWGHVMDLAKPVNDRCVYMMEQFFEKYAPLPK